MIVSHAERQRDTVLLARAGCDLGSLPSLYCQSQAAYTKPSSRSSQPTSARVHRRPRAAKEWVQLAC
jgi:hypothetical protein